jgi:Ni/Fe-hydrogenase subunit HybB-like protein
LIACNIVIPQFLWIKKVRLSVPLLFIEAIIVNIGMWLERFVIVITSLHRDFVPGSWGTYYPTVWDWAVFLGTMGFFASLMFIFMRILPAISIFEVREVIHNMPEQHKLEPSHK